MKNNKRIFSYIILIIITTLWLLFSLYNGAIKNERDLNGYNIENPENLKKNEIDKLKEFDINVIDQRLCFPLTTNSNSTVFYKDNTYTNLDTCMKKIDEENSIASNRFAFLVNSIGNKIALYHNIMYILLVSLIIVIWMRFSRFFDFYAAWFWKIRALRKQNNLNPRDYRFFRFYHLMVNDISLDSFYLSSNNFKDDQAILEILSRFLGVKLHKLINNYYKEKFKRKFNSNAIIIYDYIFGRFLSEKDFDYFIVLFTFDNFKIEKVYYRAFIEYSHGIVHKDKINIKEIRNDLDYIGASILDKDSIKVIKSNIIKERNTLLEEKEIEINFKKERVCNKLIRLIKKIS